ncbi:alanyl-tRNA editing protein [Candidatus Bathyarchaeota archaeon]|nr:alanyl-tRNA editing protein [Candidatus Bathyarchaeota archaeon]
MYEPNENSSEPLYVEDSHLKEFDARVVKAGPKFVILDRTAFYPESGGQPSDTGKITYAGGENSVRKVMKRGKDIYHYLDGDIPVETEIHGTIDWEPRHWNMRRHSGEHLLTGLFENRGSGPKVYSDLERLDFKPSELDEETVREVEAEFNSIVDEDIPLRIFFASREELDVGDDARKREFLAKIPRNIDRLRMVDIPGHALTFCFGTHVGSTGEIGRLTKLTLSTAKKGRKIVHFLLEQAP